MSYDLMVFEPDAAPKEHASFLAWYYEQTKWKEGHGHNDPAVSSKRLHRWIDDIQQTFPSVQTANFDDPNLDESVLADYSYGRELVYVAFSWPKSADAYRHVFGLARKNELGFFDVSSGEEEVWLPSGGGLLLVHKKLKPSLMDRISRLFRPTGPV